MQTQENAITGKIFRDFFPPPRFLEMPAVGFNVSDSAVTALELVRKGEMFAVGRFGRALLPSGTVVDGYVRDKERVVAELRKLKKELGLTFVNASLPEEKAYLYKTKIPFVPQKEVRGAVEFTVEENVPISPAEAIFDYTIIRGTTQSPETSMEVSVTVLPRAVVGTYSGLFNAAGLVPLSFEIGAQAICRAVIAQGDRGTYLVAHLGEEKTGLFIVSGEIVRFTATVAVGGAAIAETFLKNPARLNPVRRFAEADEGKEYARQASTDLFPSRAGPVAALRVEVNKLSTYWQTHADSAGADGSAIGKVVLCGSVSGLAGLDEHLSRSLALTVETANVWRNALSFDSCIPPISHEESFNYAAAVGLAMPKNH